MTKRNIITSNTFFIFYFVFFFKKKKGQKLNKKVKPLAFSFEKSLKS